MKFTSSQDIVNLLNILTTCAVGGIESVIIEDGLVRGINEARTFVIISDNSVPKFSQKIGLSRLTSLRQRIDLFSHDTTTVIEAKESERGEISSLEISAGRNKAQFRCTSTMLIKAPKVINDVELCDVTFSKDELKMALSAVKVMGGKTVQLIIKKDTSVTLSVTDDTNDAFNMILAAPALNKKSECTDSVVHYYFADMFHAMLRANSDCDELVITVGQVGTIRTKINGHNIIVMPKINENEDEE